MASERIDERLQERPYRELGLRELGSSVTTSFEAGLADATSGITINEGYSQFEYFVNDLLQGFSSRGGARPAEASVLSGWRRVAGNCTRSSCGLRT